MTKDFLNIEKHDSRDPNPWLAMYLDNSIPFNKDTKEALMRDNNSRSTKYLLPFISLWSKVTMFFIHVLKFFFPKLIDSSRTLHRILAWGLKQFVSPDANLLIFRHFHVGSEILQFIAKNIDGVDIPTSPIKPKNFQDVKDDIFLKHDLNLYNFVINLNKQLADNKVEIKGKENLDLSMITEGSFDHIEFPKRWTNVLDLRSAIELFTPFYQLFLTANDFVRATNSLQLDETIGIYASKILNSPAHLGLINNRHPMVPLNTYSAAFRLVLHGLAAETLHAVLVSIKQNKNRDGIIVNAMLNKQDN
jgi:hypothetical protein